MIRINLLPEEYRSKARTPLKLMIGVSLSVAIVASLAAYWGWLAFGQAARVEARRSVLQLEMDGLTPQIDYHKSLQDETALHSSRESTLAEITQSRILWTRKLDEFIDVVTAGRDGVRHYVWFDDLKVQQQNAGGRANAFGTFKANGHSGSAQWNQLASFLEDVEDPTLSNFSDFFGRPAMPAAAQSPTDQELVPSETWSFPFAMALLSPQDRQAFLKTYEESK
ncbi:MAG: hypothetical protein ACI841_000792 [Planctomycetota bacterium]|jgi:hypothetical protein